jgi:hypothetical protein
LPRPPEHAVRPDRQPRLFHEFTHERGRLVLIGFDAAARQIVLKGRRLADLDDGDVRFAARADAVSARALEIGQAGLGVAELQGKSGHCGRI